jgi:hypothetical protein
VRDGDPAALEGLCDARGPAVLAYSRSVAGDASAAAAAAEAFAAFRAAVHAAEDPADLNPELLLLNATRQAAARHASVVAQGICAAVPRLLAARADRSIMLADLERLEAHLETCWTCRAPVARFKAAERAYRDPPDEPVPREAAEAIVAALAAAAPLRADEPPPEPEPEPAPAVEPPPALHPEPAHAPEPARLNGGGHADPEITGLLPLEGVDNQPEPLPASQHAPASRLTRMPRPRRASAGAATQPPRAGRGASAAAGGATQLPRPERGGAAPRRPRSGHKPASGPGLLRPSIVLPVVLVAIALLVALFVSGVFGADDPTPTSGTIVPSAVNAPPASSAKKPEIVVVPGAGDASGAAVERAKKRARAASRRAAAATRPASAAATPPPPPAVAAAPPPPPPAASPKPASKPKSSSATNSGIDANNGATGAEQLPTEKDTSTVPDLTPPPDPVLDPPGQ